MKFFSTLLFGKFNKVETKPKLRNSEGFKKPLAPLKGEHFLKEIVPQVPYKKVSYWSLTVDISLKGRSPKLLVDRIFGTGPVIIQQIIKVKNEETDSDFLNDFLSLHNKIFRKLNFHGHDLH